jgi:putative flippase GtrA
MDTRLYRFVLAGGAATLTTYLVLIAGVEAFNLPAVAASALGYALGIVVNYVLNYRFTFNARQRHTSVFPKFLAVMLIGMLANAAIMAAGVELLGLHYVLAQFLAIAVVLSWSYTANRLWSFAG